MSTTRMIETTSVRHDMPGTHDELVQNMVALGWEVIEEAEEATSLKHPLITGTTRYLIK